MGAPSAIGLCRDEKHRYYWNGDGPYPSVTGVVKMFDKSGVLVNWAKRETALCAVRNYAMLGEMLRAGGPAAAAGWLKTIPDYQRDTAADLGSRVHALAEAVVRGETPEMAPDEVDFVNAYQTFLAEWRPEFLAVEALVMGDGYAGTLDAIARIDGVTWLLDVKTGKGVYDEYALQLAAYARASFIGKPGDARKYRLPTIERLGIIHVRPEGAHLVPLDVDINEAYGAFLHCLGLYRWKEACARSRVVGEALRREVKAA